MSNASNPEFRDLVSRYKDSPDFMYIEIKDVHAKSRFGDELIHFACVSGNVNDVRLLLSLGADVNVRGEDGFTPLHYAVQQSHRELVRFLVENGADAQLEDSSGYLPEDHASDEDNFWVKAELERKDYKST